MKLEVKKGFCLILIVMLASLSSGSVICHANSDDGNFNTKRVKGATTERIAIKPSKEIGFKKLAQKYIDWMAKNYPSEATYLGIHDYDGELEDYSKNARLYKTKMLEQFASKFKQINYSKLSRDNQIDWNLVLGDINSKLLEINSVQAWKVNPDKYSSSANNSIYMLVQRNFAPLPVRLKKVISRESKIPSFLNLGMKNLKNESVPKIYAEIALEQMPGIIGFFKDTLPKTFEKIQDKELKNQFEESNHACIVALTKYKKHIKEKILPVAKGEFAIGEAKYLKKLYFEELVDEPIDNLLARGEVELKRLKSEFIKCAKSINPQKKPLDVYTEVASLHPKPQQLVSSVTNVLEDIRKFCVEKPICTIPGEERARVTETPAFMKALIFAAMDTPGPFEKKAKEAYYYVTVPDASWDKKRTEEHMRCFSNQDLLNTSIHEAYPGHYVQFLWVNKAPTQIRKVFGCMSNAEGWAHYCELMMIEEGYKNKDPKLRLTQIHDALLRAARYIAGIKMHTKGMTLKEAVKLFEEDGFQEPANALREAKRGTMDPTYLVYTLGKLEILKMRSKFKSIHKDSFELKKFHDEFLKQGYPPLALVRAQMFKEPIKKHF